MDDPRFSAAASAPIFKKQHRDKQRVKLDERFQTVLTDDRFRVAPGKVDKYGRKAGKASTAAAAKELEDFYQIEDNQGAASSSSSSSSRSSSARDGTQRMSMEERLEYLNRLSRGEISGESSEEEEEDNDDDDDDDDDDDGDDVEDEEDEEEEGGESSLAFKAKARKHKSPLSVPEPEEEVPMGEASSNRLALQHCEWDALKVP